MEVRETLITCYMDIGSTKLTHNLPVDNCCYLFNGRSDACAAPLLVFLLDLMQFYDVTVPEAVYGHANV